MRILLLFCILPLWAQSQASLDDINERRIALSRNGMIALGSWATANIAIGTVGYFTAKTDRWKYFHEMNVFWNAVNLGIAIPGLIGSFKEQKQGLSFQQIVKKTQQTQTAFLVNGVLDISYITTGFLLRELETPNRPKLQARLEGYGNALIVQGGFLMLFDLVEYFLHKKNSRRLDSHWQNLTIYPQGMGLGMRYVW